MENATTGLCAAGCLIQYVKDTQAYLFTPYSCANL
ncbi:hypothetical protein P4S72_12185 [Vibrio sp. PP-XX7]